MLGTVELDKLLVAASYSLDDEVFFAKCFSTGWKHSDR